MQADEEDEEHKGCPPRAGSMSRRGGVSIVDGYGSQIRDYLDGHHSVNLVDSTAVKPRFSLSVSKDWVHRDVHTA